MKILVHIREKTIPVECGDGPQRLKWLADVAIARYDSSFGIELGAPRGLKDEDGNPVEFDKKICDVLEDGSKLHVVLRDEEE